jgi:hypothetical protein
VKRLRRTVVHGHGAAIRVDILPGHGKREFDASVARPRRIVVSARKKRQEGRIYWLHHTFDKCRALPTDGPAESSESQSEAPGMPPQAFEPWRDYRASQITWSKLYLTGAWPGFGPS